ncbi:MULTISPECIES: hypothetical protein [unclassified Nocardioides]|uniref:hypothetical protein n=1 Tax=unclassified Nocardioides TaxID=2615069 RepID=UPI0009EFAD6E|nr:MULTISPECIES: hypothetical protein [unclassified Nocardioides]GAW51423.1 uncharacterized protein (Precursor) [Nocardioides sp. PD653-B2]GAW54144.1 uncharacterized protein (Precursor) [Nocardioides sp. PD653]
MSDQLTAPADELGAGERSGTRAALLQFLLAVAVIAALGALGAVVWNWVWTPPVGVVSDHQWLAEDEAGLRGQFSSTGWFVVVAGVAGLLGGALVALLLDRVPLLTLVAVVVGSVIATWLMIEVGSALGPPDPRHLALTAEEGTHLPADLTVSGAAPGDLPRGLGFLRYSPWIALPTGALVGLTLVFLGLSARARIAPAHEVDAPPAG